ncbi:ADR268Wp [Eremothecium gossypii ATCC 10895]|uniref:ADR268Wp n=1 Tax=Eremothecium gossypii (strain ATCC 10895 / CBS 109.51 / FGSC 9923 / NRRL Y-1056) TaxID=284811 RepID=Q759K8_EREGS|nr:ADR268Wp [Eremothecium gossypii ATCC 10895]AAS52188.1 ADR268Wp [Eremothecium gossypii ATCC 10895]
MRFNSVLCVLGGALSVAAFSVKDARLRFPHANRADLALGAASGTLKKAAAAVTLGAEDGEVRVELAVDGPAPEQASLMVTAKQHAVDWVLPRAAERPARDMTHSFVLDVAELPRELVALAQADGEPLAVSVILASPGADGNVFAELFDLDVGPVSADVPSVGKALPEIRHVFNQQPKTVAPFFALVFCVAVAACVVPVVGVWMATVGGVSNRAPAGSPLNSVGFLGAIVAAEVTFARYYLGSSIFTTLAASFYVAVALLYFGSRTLRCLPGGQAATTH